MKRVLLPVLVAGLGLACTRTASIPDPKATADAWAEAADKGDSEALYGMLTKRSQESMLESRIASVMGKVPFRAWMRGGYLRLMQWAFDVR